VYVAATALGLLGTQCAWRMLRAEAVLEPGAAA
jgi:hypothetical protein